MQELVEYIVKRIVDEPEKASVATIETDDAVIYEVTGGESDIGKVIGRRGRVAEALRTIVRAVPGDEGVRRSVEIVS